ncbi:hypothetical protein [Myroides phaeus]|uniref:Chaperone of endosialidase n=1 Tax=Myroides phaeus TaxID=702745 RepID=A0A1G8DMT1_9FLAO|nr:hypothetical protein [Myroides phaeus]SDH58905.1 hypothetical protein SAMN05421818_10799 [Myroides phaeus]
MKKRLLPLALLIFGGAYAQTGIGTDIPHSSAVLHVSASDKGVLLPEVKLGSLTDVNVISGKDPKEGLIIYNLTLDSTKNLSIGFYYWGKNPTDSKKQWIKIVDDLDIPKFIQDSQVFVDVTLIDKVLGTKGAGVEIDTKKGGATITFTETLTATNRHKADGALDNITVAPTAGMTYYEYVDESGATRYITVSQDVSNDFSKIVNDGSNKTVIEDIIKEVSSDVKVIERNGDVIFVVKDGENTKEINITEMIKNNSYLASLSKNTETSKNTELVKMSYVFKDGKDGSDPVIYNESLTKLIRGTDANNNKLIAYNYQDETGQNSTTQITVSQDVITDFETIVKDPIVTQILNSFITEATGNVSVSKVGNDIIISYAGGDDINLTTEIARVQKYTKVIEVAKTATTAKGLTIDTNQVGTTPTTFLETVTPTDRYVNGSVSNVTMADSKFTYYKYIDELGTERFITVSQDVSNDFSTIVNDEKNRTVIENIVKANAKNPWLNQETEVVATEDDANISHSGTVAIGGKTLLQRDKAANIKLSVAGDIVSSGKFFSANSVYADYVFEKYFTGSSELNLTYEFKSLDYVRDFVEKYNHLPGVTKISEVERNADGNYMIDFTELSIQQLEKIEELYLHTIEQQDALNNMQSEMDVMKARLDVLELLLSKQ